VSPVLGARLSETVGGASTVIVWLAVLLAPRLSNAFANAVCDPAAMLFQAIEYGAVASDPSRTPST